MEKIETIINIDEINEFLQDNINDLPREEPKNL